MTALHLNLYAQLGPDHNIHVVPGVSKSHVIYLFLLRMVVC